MLGHMRWVITLALVLGLSGLTTNSRAEDPMLTAVDQLASTGQCEAALVLLDHIDGTEPAFYGRRALCEAALGRVEEAATHVEAALDAPSDEWVMANRAALLRTARATAHVTTVPNTPTSAVVAAGPTTQTGSATVPPVLGNPYRANTSEPATTATYSPAPRVAMTRNPYRLGFRDEPTSRGDVLIAEPQILSNPYTLAQRIEGASGLASNPYYYDR